MGQKTGSEDGEVRREIRFLLNGQEQRRSAVAPSDMLLGALREGCRLTGTKEGCNEGDCGACTVLVGRVRGDGMDYRPVNACIRPLATVDGCHVVTVEGLAEEGANPVQQALVAEHGSQCGFCTPGIAVALTALWLRQPEPTEAEAKTALQGNLCRCTGYAPILRAAVRAGAFGRPEEDPLVTGAREVAARLVAMADGARVEVSRDGERAVLPSDLDDLLALRASVPEATLVAGATDVGLWATKRLDPIAPALFIGHLDELARIEERADGLRIGALASYADMVPVVTRRWRWALGYWMRIGGEQVRAMGTIGGNIANGSPIGDTPPLLMALGAELVLASSKGRRRMPLEDFFLDYGRQDLRSGEIVEAVEVPDPGPQDICAAHKVSKRRDEDISALAMGLRLTVDGGEVASARIAFGGMAATPRRARAAEAALTGRTLDGHAIEAACSALEQDLTPISDCRASAAYRMTAAKGLLRRVWLEQGGAPVTLGAEEPA